MLRIAFAFVLARLHGRASRLLLCSPNAGAWRYPCARNGTCGTSGFRQADIVRVFGNGLWKCWLEKGAHVLRVVLKRAGLDRGCNMSGVLIFPLSRLARSSAHLNRSPLLRYASRRMLGGSRRAMVNEGACLGLSLCVTTSAHRSVAIVDW